MSIHPSSTLCGWMLRMVQITQHTLRPRHQLNSTAGEQYLSLGHDILTLQQIYKAITCGLWKPQCICVWTHNSNPLLLSLQGRTNAFSKSRDLALPSKCGADHKNFSSVTTKSGRERSHRKRPLPRASLQEHQDVCSSNCAARHQYVSAALHTTKIHS